MIPDCVTCCVLRIAYCVGAHTIRNKGAIVMGKDTLTITDSRTGKTYEIRIENDTIRATDLRQIKVEPDDFGMMSYDPAYMNTAACKSRITYIDGDKGIL